VGSKPGAPLISKPPLRDRARQELRSYAVIAGYLFVCFAVLMFYESTLPGGGGTGVFSLATAAVKALILGKFILIGEAVGVGERSRAPHLAGAILAKCLQFLLLLVVLTVLEELIVGRVHGVGFAQTLAGYETRSLLQVLAKCLVGMLILLPFVAFKEVSRVLGPGVLRRMLTERVAEGR